MIRKLNFGVPGNPKLKKAKINLLVVYNITHRKLIPQWTSQNCNTEGMIDIPTNRIVGTMVIGPMKRSNTPTNPVAPIKKWIIPDAINAPCN